MKRLHYLLLSYLFLKKLKAKFVITKLYNRMFSKSSETIILIGVLFLLVFTIHSIEGYIIGGVDMVGRYPRQILGSLGQIGERRVEKEVVIEQEDELPTLL